VDLKFGDPFENYVGVFSFRSEHPPMVVVAILVTVNITSGSNLHTQRLLDCELIPSLCRLLYWPSEPSKLKYALLAISNIAAGSQDQVQRLIEAKVYEMMPSVFKSASDRRVKNEILHVLTNTMCCGSDEQRLALEASGCTEIIEIGAGMKDEEALKTSLDGLLSMKQSKLFKTNFSGCNILRSRSFLTIFNPPPTVLSQLQSLLAHKDPVIRKIASEIRKPHFSDD
jgi:hypothetical protein